ncbi:hypothetical protein N408_06585 [Helicobacter pylori FD703]|nr:hypothetical protein N408_06585 [Helicobacter pylori FD703]
MALTLKSVLKTLFWIPFYNFSYHFFKTLDRIYGFSHAFKSKV